MKLHHLKPAPGSRQAKKRVGRGIAAGGGKTAGRGTKGYLARNSSKQGFEGGQMPLTRRVPKWRGFKNPNREEWAVVNVERLAAFDTGARVGVEDLRAKGMVPKRLPVKILGRGDLGVALTVQVHAVSASARQKIEQAGGSVEII
ncbi:MAG: 50S ribosomal protein L15 [Actinobacteria bacterium]|nr:50S ribosomal protein L15 [Actinomycetota bacterium]